MQIVPVIDIRGGTAVRALAGERASYLPLRTALADSSDPVAVARGYRAVFPFAALYIADLDGIEGRGANTELQRRVADAWPGEEVWLDDGGLEPRVPHPHVRRVIGSESLLAPGSCKAMPAGGAFARTRILSLDFRGPAFLGPPELIADPSLWPGTVIVMTLASVGRDEGPDLPRVAAIVAQAGTQRRVFAAGGVRGMDDVRALKDAGAAGVLIASALHAGKIKTGDLEKITG